MCSHENIIFSMYSIQNSLKYNSRDKIAIFLPFSFDYGLYQVYMALASESQVYIGRLNNISFDYLNFLKKNSITVLPLVSQHLKILLIQLKKNKIKLKIRLITNTGSELRHDLIKDFLRLFGNVEVFSMYGLTECKRVSILRSKEYLKKYYTVGKPIKGTNCWLIDKKGKNTKISVRGRHDPCVLPRAVPMVEAMTLLVMADHWLRNQSSRIATK